ncbi:3-hydroxyacyl-ACP dehydratase FabZ family protein [Lentilactobacillus kosonis]|uniref:3-hydroxyacyl-[acyl-carrier-protein] dehydratase, FabZ form n=1 Tax=Lentilactobacillus kosonis TaxID=2810561 RepID=A0A401FLD6_9LACO|nr:3-hydroxyacyl-ACP dehydratase FabZ family protein [Lentilactobacillus kosonis]GAY73202.1 3-hydroxyacyl-[acyl-carrier-protein] dehydratase, FabZ form [Lentilactobacillus kosonis]
MDLNVQDVIPQRYPFQMIDYFNEIIPGESASATKLITINEWFFANQPQNHLIVPRPILIEAVAQTGVAAILSMDEYQGKNVFFGGIRSAKFYDDFRPGDELVMVVKLQKLKLNVGVGHGEILRDNQIVTEADLVFAIE